MFTEATFQFLHDLEVNNSRGWFALNKSRYESHVLIASLRFVEQMVKPLRKVSPYLIANSAKSGGSLLRIYRDTRFSKDKSPYKTNIGIQFRHEAGKDIHAPGLYLHLSTGQCFLGAGCYLPESKTLAQIRGAIATNPKVWTRARDDRAFRESYQLWGESLKTSPRDFPKDHPMIEDLRRKDFIGLSTLSRDEMLSESLVEDLVRRSRAAKRLMSFLCDALGVPY